MTFTIHLETLNRYEELLAELQGALYKDTMVQHEKKLQNFFCQDYWHIVSQLELSKKRSQWQSAITEIHRHMRLLAVEASFAQAAHHDAIHQQRLKRIEQRLQQLRNFNQVLIHLLLQEQV
ncbi:MAG: heterocyst frequency control protein PatD [Leptolyngbya sp. SIO3F4]|nr:heterocyst frequency control protein PatD [Leptolyngbya sp. SIO3F4]